MVEELHEQELQGRGVKGDEHEGRIGCNAGAITGAFGQFALALVAQCCQHHCVPSQCGLQTATPSRKDTCSGESILTSGQNHEQ